MSVITMEFPKANKIRIAESLYEQLPKQHREELLDNTFLVHASWKNEESWLSFHIREGK